MTVPVPIYDGSPVVIPPDDFSRRLRDGLKAGAHAVARRELEEQVHQLEQTLPAAPPRRSTAPGSRQSAAALRTHTASGARHNAADRESIQIAHDALCKLAAAARTGSQNDQVPNP